MADAALESDVAKIIATSQFTIPQGGDKVYKDECVYSFDGPTSEGGIYVCLSTLLAVSPKYLKLHVGKKKKKVFLHLKKVPKEVVKDEDDSPPEKKPTKLAIGVEGGFDVDQDKVEYEDKNSLVVTDDHGNEVFRTFLPNHELPLNVQLAIQAVLAHHGASLQENIQAWEEKRNVSKHAETLKQLDNGINILPSGWKCSLCDLTQNLWLNLTDGTILCGRKYFDGTGGNNHALEYYQQTGYPLTVKLGTITAEGGDVYSYDEDDMVEDPKLAQHLKHFGIDIASLEKTDKTMTELEIEANLSLKAEWDAIQESGKKLVPLYGPGYTGMINLGNSCYMNSVMQVLFTMDEFRNHFTGKAIDIFTTAATDPPVNFDAQMAKLGLGLACGDYSKKLENSQDSLGVKPQMLKSLIGRGHVEFSTNHQQDAQEYLLHVLDLLETNKPVLKECFTFQFEDRIQCCSSNKVQYKKREDVFFGLQIPLEAVTNKSEYAEYVKRRDEAAKNKEMKFKEEVVRQNITFEDCLKRFFETEILDDYYSAAIKGKTAARKTTRFATFPDYLVIQLRKFTVGADWRPTKLDVSVHVPDELDLSQFRGGGLQAGEEELPEDSSDHSTEPEINEELVAQLIDMGFPLEACKKAVYYSNNQGVEAAMNWVFEHSQDADFSSPLQIGSSGTAKKDDISQENVAMLLSMGFMQMQAENALKRNGNNIEAAMEWILTNPEESMNPPTESSESQKSEKKFKDGAGRYRLFAFISHMGTSTSCGHYVCHILKDGRWAIFNDRKVAASEQPPRNLGYLYFYKRVPAAT